MSLFISCSLSKRQIFQVLELTKNKKTGGFHVILLHNYSFFALFIRFSFAYIQIVRLRLIFRLQSYAIRFSACGCGAVCKWPEIFAEIR